MGSPDGNDFMGFVPSLNIMNGNSKLRDRASGPEKVSALRAALTIPLLGAIQGSGERFGSQCSSRYTHC